MAFTGKSLADGQVPSTTGTLYTVPALTTTYVKFISFTNTIATPQTIQLFFNRSGTNRQVGPTIVLNQGESEILDSSVTLSAGNLINAVTTTANAVDFIITGVEQV